MLDSVAEKNEFGSCLIRFFVRCARKEGSLKLEMLSLAKTSKYVDSTIVLRQLRLKGLIKFDSDSVVMNSYPCFLIDKIVPMRNRL